MRGKRQYRAAAIKKQGISFFHKMRRKLADVGFFGGMTFRLSGETGAVGEEGAAMRTDKLTGIRQLIQIPTDGDFRCAQSLGEGTDGHFFFGMKLGQYLPVPLIDTLRDQWNELARLDERIARIEASLLAWMRQDRAAKAIFAIPGVGLLTATAAVAAMGDAKAFRSGREFAAWIGLIPGQTGSGGKVRLLGMSKRGDVYLRTLLIHGARAVLRHAKEPGPWLKQLSQRRPPNVVIVALANKMARMIWAVLAHERAYDKDHVSLRPYAAAAA